MILFGVKQDVIRKLFQSRQLFRERHRFEVIFRLVDLLLLLRLGGGCLGWSGLLLFLGLEDGLDTLFGELDFAEDSDKLWKLRNALKPGAGLGCSLSETLVQDDLEWKREATSEEDISKSDLGAHEPVTSKSRIN